MKSPAVKLRTRIGFYFLGLVATWTLFVLILLGDFLTRTSRQLLRDRGAHLTRMLAVEAAPLVHYDDIQSLARLFAERTKPPSDVRYVIVLKSSGDVVYSSFPSGVPLRLLSVPHPTEVGPAVAVQLIQTRDEQLYDYEAVETGIRVRMGMTLTPVQSFAQQLTTHILWIGVAGLLAVFAVALHVSRPVEALTVAVARSAEAAGIQGNTPLDGTLETSALAAWFGEALGRLEEKTQQLDKSKKLAYLGEISTSIAHEINNPLGIIVLNAGFLARRVSSGELVGPAAAEVERVRGAAMRATLASQKLLQFARYSMQRTGIKRRPVQPEPFVRETVELLRDRIRLSECTVEVEIPPGLPAVSLDPQAIQQVLFNLLTNALDASPAGSHIRVRAEVTSGVFALSVVDEGRGMTQEQIARAKEPFFTTKDPGKGTGLGLAISDSIMTSHGGDLSLESAAGQGTTVTLRVPLGVSL